MHEIEGFDDLVNCIGWLLDWDHDSSKLFIGDSFPYYQLSVNLWAKFEQSNNGS